MPSVGRIAPTPSGYLHIGNAANFLLTWLAVRLRGGRLLLRIDDLDKDRCKPEYVEDVFASLEWLGIEPDGGPSGVSEFYGRYSQTLRYGEYRTELENMAQNGAELFACNCSRRQLAGTERYPGSCRKAGLEAVPLETAIRIAVPDNTDIEVGDDVVPLDRTLGDFVLWRRDDVPAYQLVSVIEDRRLGVNLIIRGRDLLESSAAQLFLAPFLNADAFADADFLHHALIRRPDGGKFSKSDSDLSLQQMRRSMGEVRALNAVYLQALQLLGLPSRTLERPDQLLELCREALAIRVETPGPLSGTFFDTLTSGAAI